jgi:hypothetical protein
MKILEEFIGELSGYAEITKLNQYKTNRTLYIKLRRSDLKDVLKIIESILLRYESYGEIISLYVNQGDFKDLGIKTIIVDKGFIWELYLYESNIHLFIRLLLLSSVLEGDEWLALYIDYNPDSAWWTADERQG